MESSKTIEAKNQQTQSFFAQHIWTYRSFLLIIIIGAMVNNLDHSAELYMKISDRVSQVQAYSVVIIFDLIVIALIWVGDPKALLFAITVFFIDELAWDGVKVFYQIVRKGQDITYQMDQSVQEYLTLIEKGITMLIYGGTFAFTVHHFSHLFKKQLTKRAKLNSLIMKLRISLAELTCICGERFENISSKFGHQRKCKSHKNRAFGV
ncbi:hypothetical protein FNH22_31070 [Fulvivirga sp. M361]|uniref:hypothetical protein n=1 Tax=Fulvivirga sp. M361 TaxID=2594266 RepID=UPI00117A3386|nr:hypothetical protein [Fulvivirga sp. M361]TRX46323.1 hypothetical protein FNH22_31070 [Fulvivirga sp. M361]